MSAAGPARTVKGMLPRRRPARPGVPLAALLLGASLALGGCSDGDGDSVSAPTVSTPAAEGSSGSPSESRSESAAPQGDFGAYVALGDSYTAAPLVGETVDEGCLRSDRNYPALVAERLGATLTDVSCSGADTTSLVGVQRTLQGESAQPQFDALQEDTALVTIGIGGNDFGVFSRLIGCSQYREQDPDGSPCSTALGPDGVSDFRADLDKLGPRLESVVAGVRDRSPEAEVVVVGYPQIVPPDGTCSDRLPLATGDYRFVGELNQRLVRVQQRAAEAAGATYVDVYAASDGHDICSDEPWINGPESTEGVGLAFHPLEAEQQAVADLVLEALDR